MNRIGIDLGGTKIEGVLLSSDNKMIERKRIHTKQEEGYESIIHRIVKLINNIKSISIKDCQIGICTPGALDIKTGILKNSNTVCLIGKPIKEDLESELKCSIAIDNDANCFAMAEALLGSGKNYEIVFGVIMGTGVGGGLVLNRKIHHGRLFIAGEWGHQVLYPNGRDCYCNKKGCVETYLSGPSLEKEWEKNSNEFLPLKKIIELYDNRPNDNYTKWKNEFLSNFGIALSNVINIIDPDVVVLGGGLSNINFLYSEGILSVQKNIFSNKTDTPIVSNKLGDSAGVFGAALLN
ncbi:MAG: sugar kinase [Candidatus Marinimicrobia bacterium]|nr:sugar kinase [Candidatus Neomarinimicrobiota bacterium]|tara:strand:- start:21695 stop:22576 length:882 start_codon:yes stop_codon:yes gene_type:complete